MSRSRVWVVNVLIALIAWGSLFDLMADDEHWPFSNYAMYSGLERDRLSHLVLVGVTRAGTAREIPLRSAEYIRPFDQSRLATAFEGMGRSSERDHLLTDAVRDCLARYEALRLAGRHEGPPLQGVRLYRLLWRLDPWARNVDRPDRRDLVLEIMLPAQARQ